MSERDKSAAAGTTNDVSASNGAIAAERSATQVVADYEAQLEDMAELIARVRHEINNPLAGILGQAQLLLREELNDKARRRAETIEQLATRLRDVVAQLRLIQRSVKGFGSE
jgi:signal transduction histidine kinase